MSFLDKLLNKDNLENVAAIAQAVNAVQNQPANPQSQATVNTAVVSQANGNANSQVLFFDPAAFQLNQNGPIVTGNDQACFDDRFEAIQKWYLPSLALKQPLLKCFTLTCRQSGIDGNSTPRYSGEAAFIISKGQPAAVRALVNAGGGTQYHEIPLSGLAISFVVTLDDKSTLTYPTHVSQNGDDYTATIKLESQESLSSFYKFISTRGNAKYCAFSVSGSYSGYVPKVQTAALKAYEAAYFGNRLQVLQGKLQPGATIQKWILNPIVNQQLRAVLPQDSPVVNLVNLDDDYDAKAAMAFSQTIANVNFDCANFPLCYVEANDQSGAKPTVFGCTPPFGDANAPRARYRVFDIQVGDISNKAYGIKQIYRNAYNGNFLVLPERYVIAFDKSEDEQMLIPSAYLFTNIDANGVNSSTATFKFNITPDVSAYQLLLIKKLILNNLPGNLGRTLNDIFIEFPISPRDSQDYGFTNGAIRKISMVPMGAYENGVAGSNLFNLQFHDVPIADGTTGVTANQLRGGGGGMVGTVAFDLDADADSNPESTIMLSLACASGNDLALHADQDGARYLVNRTLYALGIDACQTEGGAEQAFTPTLLLPQNSTLRLDPGVPANPTLRYSIDPGNSRDYIAQVLQEVRFDQGNVHDDITVTNNGGLFGMFNIAAIDFSISIINPGETNPGNALSTNSLTLSVDGAINKVQIVMPVARYQSKWAAVYSTVVKFQNGAQQANGLQYIDDLNSIGKLINLTVSRLNLHRA